VHHECVETGVDLKDRDYAAASVAAEGSDFGKKKSSQFSQIFSHERN
jgi:hypothetical protein